MQTGPLSTATLTRPTAVTSPFTGSSAPESQSAPQDQVSIQGGSTPAPPAILEAPAAEAETGSKGKKLAVAIAIGLAGVTLVGVAGPLIQNVIQGPTTSISNVQSMRDAKSLLSQVQVPASLQGQFETLATQAAQAPGQEQPGQQQQDPVELISLMALLSETSSQQLPQANQALDQFKADVGAMKATSNEIFGHVDAIMRNPGVNEDAHRKGIDDGLAKLSTQLTAFQERIATEGKGLDGFLGQNRDNLNQVGILSFNLNQNVSNAASQYGHFSAERRALNDLGDSFYDASKDLAMATEKTTSARALNQVLTQNNTAIQEFIKQVQEANKTAKTDPKAMQTVDRGSQVLKQAFDQTEKVIDMQQKEVREASTRAHSGAENLAEGLQKLINLSGGGQQQAPEAK